MDSDGDEGNEPVRKSWFGMNQLRPRLPYYFRPHKRLKSLDEFEDPHWKGRVNFDEESLTFTGVLRDTLRWLLLFAIVAVAAVLTWRWLSAGESCVRVFGEFKIGWC